jgi:hypothetical protein
MVIKNMSKIEIRGETHLPKEKISRQVENLVKERLHSIKEKIRNLDSNLDFFRRTYGLSDDEFMEAFQNGTLGDEEDYFAWKGSIQVLRALVEEQELLREAI